MLPFSSFGRNCATRRRTVSQKIATKAAGSQIPPIMPCRKPVIWQKKLSTSCRKRSLNRSRKLRQNLFHNTSSPDNPSSPLRQRENIRRKPRHREISLFANRLLRSGRSRFHLQTPNSPKRENIRQMRKHQCPRLSIQLRGFMKTQRLFLRKQCHRQWNILRVNRFLRLRRNRLLLQILRNPKCGSKHRMRKRQRLHLGIQFRGFAKTQRLLLRKL